MRRVDANEYMKALIARTLNDFSKRPKDYITDRDVRDAINTTVLLDISESLAVIADALKKEEISLDIEM